MHPLSEGLGRGRGQDLQARRPAITSPNCWPGQPCRADFRAGGNPVAVRGDCPSLIGKLFSCGGIVDAVEDMSAYEKGVVPKDSGTDGRVGR